MRTMIFCLGLTACLPCLASERADDPGKQCIMTTPDTYFHAEPLTDLYDKLQYSVSRHRRGYERNGLTYYLNHPWVRDNIHEMKGYKYWDDDPDRFIDLLCEVQHPDGFFYEIVGRANHDHLPLVGDKHKRIEPENDMAFIRLEIEADIEYLLVEAAYTAWQATGDLNALRRRLPHLERGLRYLMTDPTRWDAEHGAVKRTFTIDTWDFTYGLPDADINRRIEPGMPMAIMHGDNSGLYAACRQLATMYRAVGDRAKDERWTTTADQLRERINRLCFNGQFYTHQVLLQPVDTGIDEKTILSMSNTYDINRGLPTHDMAVRIIDTYRARREQRRDTHFAEWFTIDPPYPKFHKFDPGEYVNGGIASFVAGELAKAAFHHGREAYGADILRRMAAKIQDDGGIHFLYSPYGDSLGGGPSGWGGAAILSAMFEGLAGIRDDDVLFRRVTLSPRFPTMDIDHADVCARYGASDAYVAMRYDHDPAAKTITLQLRGVAQTALIRVLLPEGVHDAELIEPTRIDANIERIEQSRYLCFNAAKPLSVDAATFVVRYTR